MIRNRSVMLLVVVAVVLRATQHGLLGEERERSTAVEAQTSAADSSDVEQVELQRLRRLQKLLTQTIEGAKESFVFIPGGSGFIVDESGYVLTNEHVVAGSLDPENTTNLVKEVTLYLRGGTKLTADVVGHNPDGDLALLKIRKPPPNLRALPLGDSASTKVGQPVIALGDPFLVGSREIFLVDPDPSYEPAASFGIVSALHRYSEAYTDAIQVDAAVNPGNSGGPLLTLDGKVIGINGKIENPFGVGINHGIGYAIPSNQVKRFLDPLKEANGGIVRHGTIHGIVVSARRQNHVRGLPVDKVIPGSAADRLGFRVGDLILSVAGRDVPTKNRYEGIVAAFPAGSEVAVRYSREEKEREITVTLLEDGRAYLGIDPAPFKAGSDGVKIARLLEGTPAQKAGLRAGDVIVSVDGFDIGTTRDLVEALNARRPGERVPFTLAREGQPVMITVMLGRKPSSPPKGPAKNE